MGRGRRGRPQDRKDPRGAGGDREERVPTVVLARTIKGKGVSFIEDRNGWHGRPLKPEELERALAELGPMPHVESRLYVHKPRPFRGTPGGGDPVRPNGIQGQDRHASGLRQRPGGPGQGQPAVVVVDGDVKNSTYADKFFAAFPERSFQSYIAEQNMVGMAMGLAAKGFVPFIATFAAFLTRAHDQIRMAAYSESNIKLCGSHVGVSIGEDGASQMGLEDLAIFRPIPGCVVLYPSDAVSAEACVAEAAAHRGMAYIRTTRPATPLLYSAGEDFPIGGSKVVKKSDGDRATVIAAGITVFEALKAAEELTKQGTPVRVIDAYSVKPLDEKGIRHAVREGGGRVVVVEDHFEAGGLGEAVAAALAGEAPIRHLCVRDLPDRAGLELLDTTASTPSTSSPRSKHLCGPAWRSRLRHPQRRAARHENPVAHGALHDSSLATAAASEAGARTLKDSIPGRYGNLILVNDGDTVKVQLKNGTERKIRLIGIDTPELGDPREGVQAHGLCGQRFRLPEALSQRRPALL